MQPLMEMVIDAGDDADVIDIAYRCVEYDLVVIDEIMRRCVPPAKRT